MLRPDTKSTLAQISELSRNSLKRSLDLGALIQIAADNNAAAALDDLAFSAKFVTKSFDLMQRIGKEGNGYEKLAAEFAGQVQQAQGLLRSLLAGADAMTRAHFESDYLEMNTLTMQNLMYLFHDLSWYKNFQIDRRTV